jgi:serine/threonine protein phosphatase PrpC
MDQAAIDATTVRWAARTDVGRVRPLNEDAHLTRPPLFLVADGMGGHEAGEVASGVTASRLATVADASHDHPASIDALSTEIRSVNADLFAAGETGRTMGTTLAGLAIAEHSGKPAWLTFNVGDSRVYSWFAGELQQITTDHSFVQELVDSGQLAPTEARTHHQRNVITRALGAEPEVEADYWIRPIRCDEWFVICSDGLTGEVEDDRIAALLVDAGDPAEAADRLVALALDHGGRDNVTVVVVEVTAVGETIDITTETRNRSEGGVETDATMIRFVPADGPGPDRTESSPAQHLIEELPPVLRMEQSPGQDDVGTQSLSAPDLIEAMPTELAPERIDDPQGGDHDPD